MELNNVYSETRLIIETIIKTAVDVIGTQKDAKASREPKVRRSLSFLCFWIRHVSIDRFKNKRWIITR